MNAKAEIANRIMMLLHDEIAPDTQRILDMLSDYRIEHTDGIEDMDFLRQVSHFLGAKKSEGISDKTVSNYRIYLNMFSNYANKQANEVTTNDIRDFITYLSEVRHNKNSSIQTIINTLRSFFGWMHTEEYISKNPMNRIKSFKINKKDSRHPLTPEQMELLRDACRTYREKALVEFLYSSGCRVSEAHQINLCDIDFERRCVSVIGKGGKRRNLYFSVRAKLMIKQYLLERKGGDSLFCCGRKPYDRLGKRSIEKSIQLIGERAGIVKRVHPHVLRHTLASDLLNAGMDITIIQQILGHSSVGTTEIYTELNQDSVRREYEKFVA